jgi:hypothetical protein
VLVHDQRGAMADTEPLDEFRTVFDVETLITEPECF